MSLTKQDKELASEIGFDEGVLQAAKEVAAADLRKLELAALIPEDIFRPELSGKPGPIDKEGNREVRIYGVYLLVPKEASIEVVLKLREALSGTGYMAFLLAGSSNTVDRMTIIQECASGPCHDVYEGFEAVGVLKTSDPYVLVRVRLTNGANYDIYPREIIDKLQSWEQICSFDIVGAGFDWIHVLFRRLPIDLVAFAQDVYDFCPDTMDQGYVGPELGPDAQWEDIDEAMDNQTIEDFARWIERNKTLYLWWD